MGDKENKGYKIIKESVIETRNKTIMINHIANNNKDEEALKKAVLEIMGPGYEFEE